MNIHYRNFAFSVAIATTLSVAPATLLAHGSEQHDDAGITLDIAGQEAGNNDLSEQAIAGTDSVENSTINNQLPEEIANIGGPFSLTNHFGDAVTEQTYAGRHMLVFFGYSNCQIMCSISLKRIADALAILQDDADSPLARFEPLVITVDPANDTPEQLKESLAAYHPSLVGLTGTLEQLKPVYKAYRQKPSILDMELGDHAVVSHSSYFYLMGPDGKLQTFFPPVLSAETMANLIKKYLST